MFFGDFRNQETYGKICAFTDLMYLFACLGASLIVSSGGNCWREFSAQMSNKKLLDICAENKDNFDLKAKTFVYIS